MFFEVKSHVNNSFVYFYDLQLCKTSNIQQESQETRKYSWETRSQQNKRQETRIHENIELETRNHEANSDFSSNMSVYSLALLTLLRGFLFDELKGLVITVQYDV